MTSSRENRRVQCHFKTEINTQSKPKHTHVPFRSHSDSGSLVERGHDVHARDRVRRLRDDIALNARAITHTHEQPTRTVRTRACTSSGAAQSALTGSSVPSTETPPTAPHTNARPRAVYPVVCVQDDTPHNHLPVSAHENRSPPTTHTMPSRRRSALSWQGADCVSVERVQ
jgi:hypothetical protein